jgi:hypothetical protein
LYTYFETFPTLAKGHSRIGRMGDGTLISVIRGRDWLDSEIVRNVLEAFSEAEKIPYTDAGAATITAVIKGQLQRAIDVGLGVEGTATVVATSRADQLPADVAASHWRSFTWTLDLAGEIQSVTISGTLVLN